MRTTITAESGLIWESFVQPEAAELAELVRDTNLTAADAEFLVQDYHRPEVTVRDEYLLIHIHVPAFDRRNRVTRGVSLYFIAKDNHLWTVSHEVIVNLDQLLRDFKAADEVREEYFASGPLALALHIVGEMHSGAFHKLERLSKHVDIAEDAIFQGNERKMGEEVSMLMRDVMDFRKVIRLQTSLFDTIPEHDLITAEIRLQWRRSHNQTLKLWDVLEGLYETVKELTVTNTSMLQHKENELLRLLTIYSVIVIPVLVLVDPFFAPGADDAGLSDRVAFGVVLVVLLGTLAFIFARSKKKRLL